MRKTIDWEKLWNDFENWITEQEDIPSCETCGSSIYCFPSWEDQKEKIQQLIDAQVREIVQKKS